MNRAHDETSQALLDAAHRLLASEGSEALTVRRIATEAGMSTMNVYSRFGGKDGVVDELYLDGYRRLFEALAAVPETERSADDLVAVGRAYRQFALDNPKYYEIMFRGFDPSPESTKAALQGLADYIGRLQRGVERGALSLPEGLDTVGTTAWLWATLHGLVSLELDQVGHETVAWPDIFDAALRSSIAVLSTSNTVPAS
jgi:AcrR family transcriptional regulator